MGPIFRTKNEKKYLDENKFNERFGKSLFSLHQDQLTLSLISTYKAKNVSN